MVIFIDNIYIQYCYLNYYQRRQSKTVEGCQEQWRKYLKSNQSKLSIQRKQLKMPEMIEVFEIIKSPKDQQIDYNNN